MSHCLRIEIFIEKDKAKDIIDLIGYAAYECIGSEGMIAIEDIDSLFPIKDFWEPSIQPAK